MVFNQYCLDFFAKVRSQANQYGLKHSLGLQVRPGRVPAQVWLWGRGQAYYDLEIAAGPDGSTAELGTLVLACTMLARSMRWGVGK
jgi:hypothetical protein